MSTKNHIRKFPLNMWWRNGQQTSQQTNGDEYNKKGMKVVKETFMFDKHNYYDNAGKNKRELNGWFIVNIYSITLECEL